MYKRFTPRQKQTRKNNWKYFIVSSGRPQKLVCLQHQNLPALFSSTGSNHNKDIGRNPLRILPCEMDSHLNCLTFFSTGVWLTMVSVGLDLFHGGGVHNNEKPTDWKWDMRAWKKSLQQQKQKQQNNEVQAKLSGESSHEVIADQMLCSKRNTVGSAT